MSNKHEHNARIKSIEFKAEPRHATKILSGIFEQLRGFLPKHLSDKEACVRFGNAKKRRNINLAINHTGPDSVEISMYLRTIRYDRFYQSWEVEFIEPSIEDAGSLLRIIGRCVHPEVTVEGIYVVNQRDQAQSQGG